MVATRLVVQIVSEVDRASPKQAHDLHDLADQVSYRLIIHVEALIPRLTLQTSLLSTYIR